MKINRFVMEEITKILKEFVDENGLDGSECASKVSEVLNERDIFKIDSEELGVGGNKFFCVVELQESEGVEGIDAYLDNEFEAVKKIVSEKKGYEKYEFVFIVRSISMKVLLEKKVTLQLRKSLITKGMSARDIDIKSAFIPLQKEIKCTIGIESIIQSLEYKLENDHIASIYTARLFDLVELYNIKGDSLFSDNVRFQIADKLDVDKKIEATLTDEPEKFWLYNNGITLLVDSTCIDTNKQRSLNINVAFKNRISIINGAQTISAASRFFYAMNINSEIVNRAKDKAKVVLRVVFCEKKAKRKDMYREISVSLNRQKAITEADMRYTDQLIDDINMLYEEYRQRPYFYIAKEGEPIKNDAVNMSDFAKISAIYLLQQPGLARSSKSKIIKVDDYWNKLRLAEYDGKTLEEIFGMKYTPFLYVKDLFDVFSKRMKKYENDSDTNLAKWCSYGTEFIVAYIVWRLNGCNNDDYSSWKMRSTKELSNSLIDEIIRVFARCAQEVYKGETIGSNKTKLDSEYKKVREHMDKNGDDLEELIKKMR